MPAEDHSSNLPEITGQLSQTQANARIIVETASDAILTIDTTSTILFANQATEKIFGYKAEDLIGQSLTILMPEYLRRLHEQGFRQYLETGRRHISWSAVELPGLHKNGQEILLELSFGEFVQEGQHFFTGIARDISNRKRDEHRLALQHAVSSLLAQTASLSEHAPRLLEVICRNQGWELGEFWILPPDSRTLEHVAGWSLPEADLNRFIEFSKQMKFSRGEGIPGEIWLKRGPVWLDSEQTMRLSLRAELANNWELRTAFGFPILLENQVLGVLDFFGRKIAQPEAALIETMTAIGYQIGQFIQRLRAEEDRLVLLAREQDAKHQAHSVTRQLAAVQRVTDAALAHLTLDDLLDEMLTRIRDVLQVDTVAILLLETKGDELYAWAARGLEEEVELGVRIPVGKGFAGKIIAEGRPIIIEDTHNADIYNPLLLEKGIASLLGVPLWIEGRAIGVVHVGTLTPARFTQEDARLLQLVADRIALAIENARLYQIERSARTEAERVNKLKDEFLTILSHELRTPLTPVMGWIHMMQTGALSPPEISQALSVMHKNSFALRRLIDDLLDMSAIISGKLHIEKAIISLSEVITEAAEMMEAYARESQVEIHLTPTQAPLLINGDRTRLIQTICNLLHNAIKFSPAQSRIHVGVAKENHAALVTVRDQGIGMAPDFIPFAFERFRQADGSRTRPHGGLGLGLALVKSFVEAHDGTVEIMSEGLNQGTSFMLRLPLAVADDSEALFSTQPESQTQPPAIARILVVEDQEDTLEMLMATFERRGFAVLACRSGHEALKLAEGERFDIIVSDIAMPELDGLDLIRQLRKVLPNRTPAIALSGYASEADAKAALTAGFDVHLAKPIDPLELSAIVEELATKHFSEKP